MEIVGRDLNWRLSFKGDGRVAGIFPDFVNRRIHAEPAASWTVASLARTSGMSRSGFSARFSDLVGEPPLRYVTRWRMRVAAKLLLDQSQASVADIASQVGYESEAAFGVVFNPQFLNTPVRGNASCTSTAWDRRAPQISISQSITL